MQTKDDEIAALRARLDQLTTPADDQGVVEESMFGQEEDLPTSNVPPLPFCAEQHEDSALEMQEFQQDQVCS